jgi:hypothetical protein
MDRWDCLPKCVWEVISMTNQCKDWKAGRPLLANGNVQATAHLSGQLLDPSEIIIIQTGNQMNVPHNVQPI